MIAARRICASKPAGRRREGSPDGLSSGNFPRHPDRARRGFSETELSVQAVRRDVGDQTDIGRLWQLVLDMAKIELGSPFSAASFEKGLRPDRYRRRR